MLGRDGGRCGDPEVTKCSTERKTHRKSWKHEVIWVICGILLVWKQSSEGGYGQQQPVVFIQGSVGTKWPKVCQEKSPTPSHHQHPEHLTQGRPDPCFHAVYTFWPYCLKRTAETFCCFSPSRFDVLCSHFGHLSYCYLSKSSASILLWPLASTGHFLSENCCLLDIFFVWVMRDYSDQSVHLSKSLRSHFYHLLMLRLNFSRSPRSSLRA